MEESERKWSGEKIHSEPEKMKNVQQVIHSYHIYPVG